MRLLLFLAMMPIMTMIFTVPLHALTINSQGIVIKVIDGDSIKVEIHHLPRSYHTAIIRLASVDAPELRGAQCEEEKIKGIEAKEFMQSLVKAGDEVTLLDINDGKYAGRYIASVITNAGIDLSAALRQQGYEKAHILC